MRDRDNRGGERRLRGDNRETPKRRERRDVGEMDMYRIEVGKENGVEVRHIVGAIANEADISSRYIGNIKLYETYSTVELPKGMPKDILKHFEKVRVLNQPMKMSLVSGNTSETKRGRKSTKSDAGDNKSSPKKRGRPAAPKF